MRISELLAAQRLEQSRSLRTPLSQDDSQPQDAPMPATPATQTARTPPLTHLRAPGTSFPPQTGIRSAEIYTALVRNARALVKGLAQPAVKYPDLEDLCEALEWTMEGLETQPARLLEYVERSTPDDYLPGHSANVTILSIALAQKMGLSKDQTRIVGMGAFLHDAGLVAYQSVYQQSTQLSEADKQAMRQYPVKSVELLKGFLDALQPEHQATITRIILQAKERISGDGYPNHLRGEQICQEAQIVGLCDTYESITHPRAYRGRRLPHETLRKLIELSGEAFDGALIKKLWETLSLFPPGSFVRLNTGEIGRVADINRNLPTRPVVRILLNAAGSRVKEERTVDLSKASGLVVEKAVDECSLKMADRRLLLELRAQKWWFW